MSTAAAELKPGTDVQMKFAWIPPGRFLMGSDKADDEKPIHRVQITKGFWMGITPVTQAQFEAAMGYNPSHFRGPDRPVESVSWSDAQEFCTAFGQLIGRPIRLPTEAEWEYACRAGTTAAYWSGDDEAALKRVGWYTSTSQAQTQPVGKLEKNPWGLCDVHGNVWEWCQDGYVPYPGGDQSDPQGQANNNSRVLRGGAWNLNPGYCRAAIRTGRAPDARDNRIGFRVCFRLD
ncbi:MAG TPA: formylglycine-generating enzyme family protein [Urbifossiella sp.]|nr:formylglycine-generating enzyme family protein [Urbifossiella sp.]